MAEILRRTVIVEPGGIVQVQSDQLRVGSTVEVIVSVEIGPTPGDAKPLVDSSWATFIGAGVSTGRTVEEIDADMRALRDEWD
jgi:hypothetical protein